MGIPSNVLPMLLQESLPTILQQPFVIPSDGNPSIVSQQIPSYVNYSVIQLPSFFFQGVLPDDPSTSTSCFFNYSSQTNNSAVSTAEWDNIQGRIDILELGTPTPGLNLANEMIAFYFGLV